MRERMAYLHFPKAAGTSVRAAFGAYYSAERTVPWSFDRLLFGPFGRLDEVREPVFLGTPDELQGFDYMEGHWSLPSILAAFEPGDVVCVLREPRARLLSHYTFWRSWPEWMHDLWEPYPAARQAQRRLSEFLSDPTVAHQSDNLCTRLLLGEHPLVPLDGFITDAAGAATEACARVDALGYADVLERGDHMYAGLEAWFGSPLSRERLNETDLSGGEPVDVADFSSRATMELVQARTAADRVVWMHVAALRGIAASEAADLAGAVFASSVGRIAAEHAAPRALEHVACTELVERETSPSPVVEPVASTELVERETTMTHTQFVPRLAAFVRRGPRAWVARARRLVP